MICVCCTNMPRDERPAGDVRSTQFTWTDATATLQVPFTRAISALLRAHFVSSRAYSGRFCSGQSRRLPMTAPASTPAFSPRLLTALRPPGMQRCPWACQALFPSSDHDAVLSSKAAPRIISVYHIFCRTHAARMRTWQLQKQKTFAKNGKMPWHVFV